MMRLIVTGSVAIDYLMRFPGRFEEHILPDRLDRLSVSFLVDRMRRSYGGVGANIAYTLALLGERPLLVGAVGQDFGEYRAWLESKGVDTSGVLVKEDDFTASFFVSTDLSGNQIASFYVGAMDSADEISLHRLGIGPDDIVVVSPDKPEAMLLHAREAKEAGARLIFDPSQQIPRLSGEQLAEAVQGAFALTVNEYEYALLQGKTGMNDEDLGEAAQVVLVTMGERGSEIHIAGDCLRVPCAPPAGLIDPTGVGDAYRAGLIKGLARGLGWDACGRMGSVAASYALEQSGTQEHQFSPEEFAARYAEVFGPDDSVRACLL